MRLMDWKLSHMFALFLFLFVQSACASVPLPVENWAGQKVMFIYAHIDDMECSSGGLISKLNEVGAEVFMLIMTNGDKGCSNDAICGNSTNEELVEIRKQEQYNSANVLGISNNNILFLGYEDIQLKLAPRTELTAKVIQFIRSVQPAVVMTWDREPHFNMIPSQGWSDLGYHPDHQYSGEICVDAVWMAHEGRLWSHLGPEWKVPEVYTWAYNPAVVPSHYFDITGEPLALKTAAFLEMKSQYSDPADIIGMGVFFGEAVAETCGLDDGRFAEGYQYILW